MAQTTILAAGTTVATSTDVVVAAGDAVQFGLFVASGGTPSGASFEIKMATPGGDLRVGSLTDTSRTFIPQGPGTYRVTRNEVNAAGAAVATGVWLETAPGGGLPVTPTSGSAGGVLPSGTDRSGTITAGGTGQQLAAANALRLGLKVQPLTEDMWINEIDGTATSATANAIKSYKVPVFAVASINTQRLISIVSATTGAKFTATEY